MAHISKKDYKPLPPRFDPGDFVSFSAAEGTKLKQCIVTATRYDDSQRSWEYKLALTGDRDKPSDSPRDWVAEERLSYSGRRKANEAPSLDADSGKHSPFPKATKSFVDELATSSKPPAPPEALVPRPIRFHFPPAAAENVAERITEEKLRLVVDRLCQRKRGIQYLSCHISWELKACVKSDLDGQDDLGRFLTITGSRWGAKAFPCRDAIRSQWGDLGLSVLNAVCSALRHGQSSNSRFSIMLDTSDDAVTSAEVHIDFDARKEAVGILHTLAWIAATFRLPQEHRVSYSSVLVSERFDGIHITLAPLKQVESDPSRTCWHPLMGSCIVAEGFHPSPEMDGLELPLPLMLELTGMIYKVQQEPGGWEGVVFYTGVHSVLYPTRRNDAEGIIMWHYVASDTVMTPPTDGTWLPLSSSHMEGKRMILGYTPSVKILLGTANRVQQYPLIGSSRADKEKSSWRFTWDGITVNAGFSGSGMSFPLKLVRRKGQRASPAAKPTYDQIIEGAADQPVILFDTASGQQTAWLVSQLSVILDLVHLKANRDKCWQDYDESLRASLYARPDWKGGVAAREVLQDYGRANTKLQVSADDGNPIAIKHLVVQIFKAMSARAQLSKLEPSTVPLSPIVGWDLLQLMNAVEYPERLQFKADWAWSPNKAPSWLPLANEVPIFFADNIGEVMASTVPLCAQIQRSPKHLFASIHALRKKLKACSKCEGFHIDTRQLLRWKLSPGELFHECRHNAQNAHNGPEAKSRVQDLVQLMVARQDHMSDMSKAFQDRLPEEGAVVFGAKQSLALETRDNNNSDSNRIRTGSLSATLFLSVSSLEAT